MNTIIDTFQMHIIPWILTSGVKIAGIVVGTWIVHKIMHSFIERIIRRLIPAHAFSNPLAEKKREDTLIRIFDGTLNVLVWLIAFIMIVSEIGVDIGPLLAGAGLVGVAFGFGAQYLVRDIITGVFLIVENQFRVGDYVCFGDTCGTVENITLRVTTLRDSDGTVHTIPNGEIKVTSNESKDFAVVNINIGVTYNTDINKVQELINTIGQEIAEDPEWSDRIIEQPRFSRIGSFDDTAVKVRVTGKVKPLAQWAVAGELRRRIKQSFDKKKIKFGTTEGIIKVARSTKK